MPIDDVFDRLGSSAEGLTDAEAARRMDAIGPNAIRQRQVTALGVLLAQLRNPLLILLLAAAAVSGLTGDPTDAVDHRGDRRAQRRARLRQRVPLRAGGRRAARDIHHEALVWRDGNETSGST